MIREKIDNHEEWLRARNKGIGASDSAAILGLSPWTTIDELWDIKTGRVIPKDISNNPPVKYGIDAEPLIREFVKLDFPYLEVDYHGMDILHHDHYKFISATLDGELIDTRFKKHRKGVLEVKTGGYRRREDLEKWENGQIPIYYFSQVCQQLAVTGWDFNLVAAKLTRQPFNNDEEDLSLPQCVWKYAYFSAKDPNVIQSMQLVMKEDIKFWDCVVNDIRPSTILRLNKEII